MNKYVDLYKMRISNYKKNIFHLHQTINLRIRELAYKDFFFICDRTFYCIGFFIFLNLQIIQCELKILKMRL